MAYFFSFGYPQQLQLQIKKIVPVLWDNKTNTIVNNESEDIVQMLNSQFNDFAKYPDLDLCPERFMPAIKEVNSWVYPHINNGTVVFYLFEQAPMG